MGLDGGGWWWMTHGVDMRRQTEFQVRFVVACFPVTHIYKSLDCELKLWGHDQN